MAARASADVRAGAAAPPSAGSAVLRDRITSAVPGAVAFLAVVGVCASQGSFYPTSWGWSALALCWLTIVGLAAPRTVELSTLELGTLLAFGLFTAWVALSTLWSFEVPETVLEVERDLIYPAGVAALLVVSRSGRIAGLLGGVVGGVTGIVAYALGTRLLQGDVATSSVAGLRLSTPIGYWNGLGITAVVGAIVTCAFVAHGNRLTRVLAACCFPTLVLGLYFTFSRGGWISLAFGLLVAIAADPRRLRLLSAIVVVGPWAAFPVFVASRENALTTTGSSLAAARHEGHRVALVLLLLTIGAAVAAACFDVVDRRWAPAQKVRRAYAAALIAATAVVLVVVFVGYGNPATLTRKAYNSFTKSSLVVKTATNYDLNRRLFTLASHGRLTVWRIAWHQVERHPLRGSGAGTYGAYWLEHRSSPLFVQDAHSLYLEQFAEVGVIGLGVLVVALLLPVAAALRTRTHRLVPVVLGAYGAFLLHQGFDWDWELPGVTLTGLLVGAALLIAGREGRQRRLGPAVRWPAVGVALALAVFAFVGLLGNRYIAESAHAASGQRYGVAAAKARSAIDWAPWSADAWRALGVAQVGLGRRSQALTSFRTAVTKDPSNWTTWESLRTSASGGERRRVRSVLLRLDPVDYRRSSPG